MKTFNKEQMIAQSHFGKLASQADVMSKKFSSIGDKMTSLGRTMTMGVSTPITLGLGAALKQVQTLKAKCLELERLRKQAQ